jgi:AcrR family transcriptional regulator
MIPLPDNQHPSAPFSHETRTVILNTAERLFGESGVEGTSVRDITHAAGVNLGAINYYFGTKDALILAVFARRLEPLNLERLRRLDLVEQKATDQQMQLEEVLCAFFEPMAMVSHEENDRQLTHQFFRLISRRFLEPSPQFNALLKNHFKNVCDRFEHAIQSTVPWLSPDEIFWRMNFCVGALNHALNRWSRFEQTQAAEPEPEAKHPNLEALIAQLVAFAAGGFRVGSLWNSNDFKTRPTLANPGGSRPLSR